MVLLLLLTTYIVGVVICVGVCYPLIHHHFKLIDQGKLRTDLRFFKSSR